MLKRTNIYDKYKKSDIFNLNPTSYDNATKTTANPLSSNLIAQDNNIKDTQKHINQKKYMQKQHESDIFNLNKSFDKSQKQKIRGAPNFSTCFDSMKDNTQYSKDIKEYTLQKRGEKTKAKYEPEYPKNENASERLYNQLYDKKRNPIVPKNANNDTNNDNNKNLFLERKKNMKNKFIKTYFDQRNINDIQRLEKETQQGEQLHKFNKSKGFTYRDNENNINENKFLTPDKYPCNSSKLNKQIQLQSNIFTSNDNKNENDIDKIRERLNSVEEEKKGIKNEKKNIIKSRNDQKKENNRNVWGVVHSKWEKSNLDWRSTDTEIIFGKTYSGSNPWKTDKNKKEVSNIPFQKKMEQLQDSENKDTINETIKAKRNYNKNEFKDNLAANSNLDQINEILEEIPENVLKYDKKKKIMSNVNSTGLNGETTVNPNITKYNKFHKNNTLKTKTLKEPTIKIMSKEGEKHMIKKKSLDKNLNNLQAYDDYNIHDFVLSYDIKNKNSKNFDKFTEKDIKLLFSKKGIHVYNIQNNGFDNGKYNVIKFRVRENEGENSLKEKIKEIENDLSKQKFNICIEKDVEKKKKKNLRNVVNAPNSKVAMFVQNNDNKGGLKKKDPLQIKNNTNFSGQFNMIDHKYKK